MKLPAFSVLLSLAAILGSSAPLSAATISISRSAELAENLTFNIDNYGALDWAIWKTDSGSTDAANAIPTNEKSGAAFISNLFLVGGGDFQTSTNSATNWDFDYTGGVNSPTSGTYSNVNGVFNSLLKTNGSGLSLTVKLPTTDTYQIFLWAAAFAINDGQLTASLTGATNAVNNGMTGDFTAPKDMYLYTVTAKADSANDTVTLSLVNNDSSPQNLSHVLVNAAAVQLIPEPSSLLLCSVGALALLRRRR